MSNAQRVIVTGGGKIASALIAALSMGTVMLPPAPAEAQRAPSAYYGESATTNAQPATTREKNDARSGSKSISYGYGGSSQQRGRRSGPGWTHAHVQRSARKERNRQRNKRAQRR